MYPHPYAQQQYWQQPYVGGGFPQQSWGYGPMYVGDAGPMGSVIMAPEAPLDWRGLIVGAAVGLVVGIVFGRVV